MAEMRKKVANYKRFRELVNEWVDLAVKLKALERAAEKGAEGDLWKHDEMQHCARACKNADLCSRDRLTTARRYEIGPVSGTFLGRPFYRE